MKLRSLGNIRVCGRPEAGDYNGNPTYKLNILTDEGAGDVRCTAEVYDMVGPVGNTLIPFKAEFLYDDKYGTLKVVRVFPADGKPATTPSGK